MKITKVKYILSYLRQSLLGERTGHPRVLSYLITDTCNSRCITCNIWKNEERGQIFPDNLRQYLDNPNFTKVQHLGISGGEPSLRDDLKDQIKVFIGKLPELISVSITTNSIKYDYWQQHIQAIDNLCKANQKSFQINLSLDGLGPVHEKVRSIKGNFGFFEHNLQFMQEKGIPLQIHTTVNSENVYHLPAIWHYAQTHQADIIFRLASEIERLNNKQLMDRITLTAAEKSFFADFITSREVMASTKSPTRRLFYRRLAQQVTGDGKRQAPCYFQRQGVVVAANGDLYHCSRFEKPFGNIIRKPEHRYDQDPKVEQNRQDSIQATCHNCYHDQNGRWPAKEMFQELILRRDDRLLHGLERLVHYGSLVKSRLYMVRKRPANVPSALVIGMYGGEHVGDAAILGGVVMRLAGQYGLKKVYVSSFRPHRTRRWVAGLALPVEMQVVGYGFHELKHLLSSCAALIWAGGPMMDLLNVTLHHLALVNLARRMDIPVLVEGVGIGPFKRENTKRLVAKVLGRASRVTVRSQVDQVACEQLIHKTVAVTTDPAFDYLATRTALSRLPEAEQKRIDRVLAAFTAAPVALNLRPLWDLYVENEAVFEQYFLDQMAGLVNRLNEQGIPVAFFAMNADLFGFSDLLFAQRLRGGVHNQDLFKILECELSVDAALYFLRKCRGTVSMRFHGCIFSLSQQTPTIGIDYSELGNGKVHNLMSGNGLADRVFSRHNLEIDQIVARLL